MFGINRKCHTKVKNASRAGTLCAKKKPLGTKKKKKKKKKKKLVLQLKRSAKSKKSPSKSPSIEADAFQSRTLESQVEEPKTKARKATVKRNIFSHSEPEMADKAKGDDSYALCVVCNKKVPKGNISLHALKCTKPVEPLVIDSSDDEEMMEDLATRKKKLLSIRQSENKGKEPLKEEDDEFCAICQSEVLEKCEYLGKPNVCDHVFCFDCLLEWSKNSSTCPKDRQIFNAIEKLRGSDRNLVKTHSVKFKALGNNVEVANYDMPWEITICPLCHRHDREDEMLLCDSCDGGFHMDCLTPALTEVPSDLWFCDECRMYDNNLICVVCRQNGNISNSVKCKLCDDCVHVRCVQSCEVRPSLHGGDDTFVCYCCEQVLKCSDDESKKKAKAKKAKMRTGVQRLSLEGGQASGQRSVRRSRRQRVRPSERNMDKHENTGRFRKLHYEHKKESEKKKKEIRRAQAENLRIGHGDYVIPQRPAQRHTHARGENLESSSSDRPSATRKDFKCSGSSKTVKKSASDGPSLFSKEPDFRTPASDSESERSKRQKVSEDNASSKRLTEEDITESAFRVLKEYDAKKWKGVRKEESKAAQNRFHFKIPTACSYKSQKQDFRNPVGSSSGFKGHHAQGTSNRPYPPPPPPPPRYPPPSQIRPGSVHATSTDTRADKISLGGVNRRPNSMATSDLQSLILSVLKPLVVSYFVKGKLNSEQYKIVLKKCLEKVQEKHESKPNAVLDKGKMAVLVEKEVARIRAMNKT